MAFFILTRFVLVKYSRVFIERPLQGTSSLALRLTTVSLDACTELGKLFYESNIHISYGQYTVVSKLHEIM